MADYPEPAPMMWVRKRIDIGYTDLIWGLLQSSLPTDPRWAVQRIVRIWGAEDSLICLSIRSGFDLFLQSANWNPGSEIIMSGLNIPDMSRIIKQHGLVPVGVDLNPLTLSPNLEDIERAVTSKTKALVIAHLFGGLVDLDPYFDVARRHNLLLIEDCAQAYVGNHDLGDPRADISMFSFGPIKTNTALAGAILRVRQAELLARMLTYQSTWPTQSRFSFLKRIGKYSVIKLIGSRLGMCLLYQSCRLGGRDHDRFISQAARGFAGGDFFSKIRHQPALPLLRMLARRLERFDAGAMVKRQQRAQRFLKQLQEQSSQLTGTRLHVPGESMNRQTFWVLPLLVEDPIRIAKALWKAGFDATNRCSLEVVGSQSLTNCQKILDHCLFLPFDKQLSESELDRMADVILKVNATSPQFLNRREMPAERTP
jgi:dTDP-4-amino-4,6-dideoxygalactose transaminase